MEKLKSSPSQLGLVLRHLESQTNDVAHAEVLLLDSFSETS